MKPKIPVNEIVTLGKLKEFISEYIASYSEEDEKYLGNVEDLKIEVWIPNEGYTYAKFTIPMDLTNPLAIEPILSKSELNKLLKRETNK